MRVDEDIAALCAETIIFPVQLAYPLILGLLTIDEEHLLWPNRQHRLYEYPCVRAVGSDGITAFPHIVQHLVRRSCGKVVGSDGKEHLRRLMSGDFLNSLEHRLRSVSVNPSVQDVLRAEQLVPFAVIGYRVANENRAPFMDRKYVVSIVLGWQPEADG